MRKRLSIIMLAVATAAAGLLLARCGDDQGSRGDFCESDSDCGGEMVCRENVCVEPEVNPCEPPCNPEVEICHDGECVIIADADDKDGDGSPAAEDCDDYDRTVHPDAFEYCDGADNDCDGQTDEDCPACENGAGRSCGTDLGECTPGDQVCAGGSWQPCSGTGPAPEKCDGLDNDCDGRTDENCPCDAGDQYPCGSDRGECTAGVEICENGAWPGCLNGQIPAGGELCDGLDNDCDGLTDEGFELGAACQAPGECGAGALECFADLETGCSTAPGGSADGSAAELCNQLDDDCDGLTDEDFADLGAPCDGDDSDECENGTFTCTSDGAGVECVNEAVVDIPETCNQLDDDCDGQTDEGLDTDSDGDDHNAPGSCSQPADDCDDSDASIHPGAAETCNQKDDDCDGQTDEDLDIDSDGDGHYLPGSCAQPADDCDDSNASVYPGAAELCNPPARDDDCDGQTDEDYPNLGTACDGGDSDSCKNGTFTCTADGSGTECVNETIEDIVEICNGQDDDCDGRVDAADSSLQRPLCEMQAGVCHGARRLPTSCSGGSWTMPCNDAEYLAHNSSYISPSRLPPHPCSDPNGRGEGLFTDDCDNLDNDCDGDTDGQDSDHDGVFEDSPDCDGDGHSPCALGQLGTEDDCCDADPWTYPGQTSYYDDPRDRCGGYDYNCDGVETPDPNGNRLWSCIPSGSSCLPGETGFLDSVPACGQEGSWANGCSGNPWIGCEPLTVTTIRMSCR